MTGSSAGELLSWSLDENEWVEQACRMAGRDLTAEEWTRYTGTSAPADLRCGVAPPG
jgi:hypothetical protein